MSEVTHELFIHHASWCPNISWKKFMKTFWCLDAVKRKTEQKLITFPCPHSPPYLFWREIGTQSHSAKFLNWGDHVNSVPDLAASPPCFSAYVCSVTSCGAAVLRKAANQLSRRSRRYKKAGCYRGDHSKLTSLPEFGLSMLFSLLSIFITVIFLIRSSAVTFPFGALNRTWILQSKPN